MGSPEATYVAEIQLFAFDDATGAYSEHGSAGCTIMGAPGSFRVGCYNSDGYICTADITTNNDTGIQLALQGNGYASFRDDQGRLWSLLFPSEDDAFTFAANVTVSMYGASQQPEARIVCCDVASGRKERTVFVNDKVKLRFQSWVVKRGNDSHPVPQLGSLLESNIDDERPYLVDVPANHNSVTSNMFGFEGMAVGMAEEGRRFIVVPLGAKRGRGPNVHCCFMIYVVKKKGVDDAGSGESPAEKTQHEPAPTKEQDAVVAPSPAQPVQPTVQPIVVYAQPQERPRESPRPPRSPVAQAQPHVVSAPPVLPAAPPGFNYDQMDMVQRMRDQMGQLAVLVKEATTKVDVFACDFRAHDSKSRPGSLHGAQMTHSLQKLMDSTAESRDHLDKRDAVLRELEERNRQLQAKADSFSKTASQLADEKKAAVTASGENKIELDRQLLTLQTQLTAVLSERQDVGRHLSTVKRLLEVSDQDHKAAKSQHQVVDVQVSTAEAKLASVEENLSEERSRRKLLEGKAVSLGSDLRSVVEEFRTKEGQHEDKRRKMDADKLHFTQMLEEERAQAAQELRDLREDLVQELASRERRYTDERQRVAKEAFERGRVQGMQEGEAETLLEADERMQQLGLDAQRHRTELDSIRIRVRQVNEQAAADRRRVEAQIAALSRVVDDLHAQNHITESSLHSALAEKDAAEAAAVETLKSALLHLTQAVTKKDLLGLLHDLRMKRVVDYSFEPRRSTELSVALNTEKNAVRDWVSSALVKGSGSVPAFLVRAPQDEVMSGMELPPAPAEPTDPSVLSSAVTRATGVGPDPLDVAAVAAVEVRQREILAAIDARDPALELIPAQAEPAFEGVLVEEDEGEVVSGSVTSGSVAEATRGRIAFEETAAEETTAGEAAEAVGDITAQDTTVEETTAEAVAQESTAEETTAESVAQDAEETTVEETTVEETTVEAVEETTAAQDPPSAPQPPSAAHRAMFEDSSDEETFSSPKGTGAAAPAGRAAPTARIFDDSTSDDDNAGKPFQPSAPAAPRGGMFADTDSDESAAPSPRPAPKIAARRNPPAAAMFGQSDSDDPW